MTPDQLEEIIERTATRTADKVREEVKTMFIALGFNMDELHEEQQMVAFSRRMYQGTQAGKGWAFKAVISALITAGFGWLVYYFSGGKLHT